MEINAESQWTDRAFLTLFSDAVEHAYLANALKEPGSIGRLARSSILSCALALESAANCCLSTIPLSRDLTNRLERSLDSLEKFEHVLSLQRGLRDFDRGCLEVQRMQDLISLRNNLVHPKTRIMHPSEIQEESPGSIRFECGMYQHLGLNRGYRIWNGEAAVIVLRSLVSFLNCYFIEWCGWTAAQAERILLGEIKTQGKTTLVAQGDELDLVSKVQTLWNIQILFIAEREKHS